MKTIIGRENIQNSIPDILYDESRFTDGIPEKVFFPSSLEDIILAVKEASQSPIPLVIIGGQTGITGGSVPIDGCYALCLNELNRIIRIETAPEKQPILYCQPAVTLEEIAHFCENPIENGQGIPGTGEFTAGAWFYPPDPTEMTAQLGGTVATNASGARSFRFGPTRNHITFLSIVLPNGETLSLNRGDSLFSGDSCTFSTDQGTTITLPAMHHSFTSLKNACGYFCDREMDLIDLFIGSEGTLGIFSEIGIILTPSLPLVGGLTFFPKRENCFAFANFLRQKQPVAAIEYFDTSALELLRSYQQDISLKLPAFPDGTNCALYWEFLEKEADAFETASEEWEEELNRHGSSFDVTWSGFDEEEMTRLKTFRHAVPEIINARVAAFQKEYPDIRKIGTDTAFPPEEFENAFNHFIESIASRNLRTVIFGHLGDFHLHFNLLPSTPEELSNARAVYQELMEFAIAHKGTVSAEHGIGRFKVPYLVKMYGNESVEEMKKIKQTIDPLWIMNQGTLFARE